MSTALKLDELGVILTGKTPKTSSPEFWSGNVPFYTPSDMNGGRRLDEVKRYITDEGLKTVKNSAIPPNSVMVSCIGAVGNICISDKYGVTNQQINTIIPNEDIIYYLYLYYSLLPRKAELEMLASGGSVLPIINKSDFSQLEVVVPPLKDQKAIAHILGTLDDKIELNQKMNKTLEGIAKAIFKSWFVDFDPVRAKAECRPTGLPPEISDLFPDELVDSEIGEIPKGWDASTFGELADIQNGYAFKSKDWSDEGKIPVVKIGNVKPMLVDVASCSRVNRETVSGLDRFRLSSGDALIGMTGYVGEVGLVPKLDELPYLNQRVGKIVTHLPNDYPFMVILVRREEFKSQVENLGTGSAQANVSAGNIKSIPVVLPTPNLKEKFGHITNPIIDRILNNAAEIEVLSELRDTLLPKLISGELCIPDAEKFLTEAGL